MLLASGALLILALVGLVLSKLLERRTRTWPKTSAAIRSATMKTMELEDKAVIVLPCFEFSYVAVGGDYSGKFYLFTDGQEEGELIARKMIKHTIEIRYDPKRPSKWYIPEKQIEGFEVGQKMFPRRRLYPKD
jgi:hypothetical protein